MDSTTVKRVSVWSGALRLSHWLMAGSVLVLLATGGLLGSGSDRNVQWLDYHILSGYVLGIGLLLRVYLLFFGRGADTLADLIPRREQRAAAINMLRFYLSLGRQPLPNWYAHNPFWQPVYLFLLVLLLMQVLSGWFTDAPYLIAGMKITAWHELGATGIALFCGMHIVAVFLHDLKGTGSDVSAMISGHRIFVIRPVRQEIKTDSQILPLDKISKSSDVHGSQ